MKAPKTRATGRPGDPNEVISVSNLSFSVGGLSILSEISFSVDEGEFVAIIGPNGAGKSTLFNLLSGLLRPSGGAIHMRQQNVTSLSAHRRSALGLGRTFQTSNLFDGLSVYENVRIAAEISYGGTARVWRVPEAIPVPGERARACLEQVSLSSKSRDEAGSLAHGDKRKLEMAIQLASGADVLLLDEPMAGVSHEDIPTLEGLLRSVHHGRQKTLLMVEHHMDILLGLADRVLVLHQGRLLAEGTPKEIQGNDDVQAAYLGGHR